MLALSQSMRWPPEWLVWFSLAEPETRRSTPVTPIRATSARLISVAVKLSVPFFTEAIENDPPVTEKPTASVVTTAVRSPFSAPPTPTNRSALERVKVNTLAPFSVPSVPLPVTTSAVADSRVRFVTTATTLPWPIFMDAPPDADNCWSLLIASAGIRLPVSLVPFVAVVQSIR